MDVKAMIPVLSDFIKNVVGNKVNYDTTLLSKLEGDIALLSQELAGYAADKAKNAESEKYCECVKLRIGIIEARIAVLNAELTNLKISDTLFEVLNLAIKLAPLLI